VPDGTATLERTIVAQDFCDLLAEAAPVEPEKVQLVARLARAASGAGVMAGPGAATGLATTEAAKHETNKPRDRETMVKERLVSINSGLAAWPHCLYHSALIYCTPASYSRPRSPPA
jgi:hypothetical protein